MADYDLDSEMAGDLTRDNDPVGHDDLNLVLEFWNDRPDDRLLALNAVLEHWGNVYASESSSESPPQPSLSCNLPEEATDLLKRHENDTFSAAAQQFPQLRQTETMVDSERTVLILHEKLVDAERVLDVCFYNPENFAQSLSLEMWYFEDAGESLGVTTDEPLQFFARVKGQSQPPLPSELRDWTQKNNHLPMSGIFDDGVASCVSPNQKRREQLAVPPPANYTDYYEGQCLWNEIDNAVRIDGRQLGGRIMKSVSDWRLFPTTYGDFTEAPSLFLSRSCTTYKSNYDCDPTKASFLSAEDCQNAHPYCETADITYWGRLTLDGTAYLNSAAYSDASWLQVRLATPKVLKERSLDATNVLVKDATPVFPVLRSFVVERPIFGQSTSRTIDISTTAKVLFVSDLTGKAQLLRQEDGAGWTAAQNASIPNVRLLEEVNF